MRRPPVCWPEKARIAIIPCVVMETWPEELGIPSSRQSELRKGALGCCIKLEGITASCASTALAGRI